MKYCSIDNAYTIINKLGPGALLSKIDLKDAFCLIPVQSSDWNLLWICWRQKFYIDTCLTFGLRSPSYLFNRLSSALHWILENNYGIEHLLHYLDEFFTAGPANSDACEKNLHAMLALCEKLNVPIKPSKVRRRPNYYAYIFGHTPQHHMHLNGGKYYFRKKTGIITRIVFNTCQEEMYETRITILNWKTFICMQNPTCWPDIFT